ncbi:MAG TPA: hypothetical protein VGH96_23635 [Streptosporangiaceae bacterium]
MQAVTVAEVADELYGLTPAEFTAARDDRARQVRAAGQRDEAAAIKKLARPTVSAWLVNQLARAPDRMTRLYELGAELQEAQRTLAGDRLRELSVQRRELINDLLPAASDLAGEAGQPASAAVLEEVRATLEAALADADARAAVQSGRLTKSLAYAGIGEVDLSAALALAAVPKSRPGEGRGRPARGAGAPGETASAGTARAADRSAAGRTQRAADAVRAAQATADEAAAALDEAERAVGGVAEQRQFLRRRISHLERELGEARAADAQLTREAKQAERSKDAAARRLATAKRQLDQARREAGRAE